MALHDPPRTSILPLSTELSLGTLGRYIVSSPYTDDAHLLDMETLDRENQLLSRALSHMTCTRDDYATASYIESFNWNECFDRLKDLAKDEKHEWRETSFYIVAFRSQIPPTTLYSELGELDKAAHREAIKSGGLLKCVADTCHAQTKRLTLGRQILVRIPRRRGTQPRDVCLEVRRGRAGRWRWSCTPEGRGGHPVALFALED